MSVALVGSANFDMRSLFTNHEVAAVLYVTARTSTPWRMRWRHWVAHSTPADRPPRDSRRARSAARWW
ncbi:MAG: hypothetical protein U1F11_06125 [Steroidobacteraceae bacterium]